MAAEKIPRLSFLHNRHASDPYVSSKGLIRWSVGALWLGGVALLCAGLVGCAGMKEQEKTKPPQTMPDQAGEMSFQAFLGRLRQAVARRDTEMIASMMTPNFGYQLEPSLEGPGVFAFWEENNLWPELELVLSEQFVPFGNYMVSPAQFAADPNYAGFRAGMTQVRGSWKFAYFVKG